MCGLKWVDAEKEMWDGGQEGTKMALSIFFLFYCLVFSLLSVPWHIHSSRVGYSLICSFVHSFTGYLLC